VIFPPIVIALRTCYILVFVALGLLVFDNTIPRLGFLRGARTFLNLFATKRPFTRRLASLGNKCYIWRDEWLLTRILYLKVLQNDLEGFNVIVMLHNEWAVSLESIFGKDGITFRACSSLDMSWPIALRSWTMPLIVRSCSVISRSMSILNFIHFKHKVCNLIADVWLNQILSRFHMSLAVGQHSNPPNRLSCIHNRSV